MIKTCPPYNQATHRPVPDAFDEGPDGVGGVQLVQRVEPIPPEEIAAGTKKAVAEAVQRHLDTVVAERSYSSAAAAVSYAGDPNPQWDAEGRAVLAWRSAVWTACFAALDAVLAGERPPLTPEEMVSELPLLVWPD